MAAFLMLLEPEGKAQVMYGDLVDQYATIKGEPVYIFRRGEPNFGDGGAEIFKEVFDQSVDQMSHGKDVGVWPVREKIRW